jgi:ABC-type polar amino acid transport system ATPase subunit
MRLSDLRRNIAVVSQEPVLFNDTILANLRLGRADATRPEVEQAAADAFAHDLHHGTAAGYETVVGERGGFALWGQRQRIALARAFLRDAPILILDEATSALDSESESFIQTALQKLMVGKTVLIIAHRFSTIRAATKLSCSTAARSSRLAVTPNSTGATRSTNRCTIVRARLNCSGGSDAHRHAVRRRSGARDGSRHRAQMPASDRAPRVLLDSETLPR